MVFIDFDPRDRSFALKLEKDLHERRLEKDLLQSIANQRKDKHKLPVFLNAISMNDPYKIGSFSPSPIGSIRPSEIDNEGNKPSPIPQSETPPQLETSPPISTRPVPLQEQPPEQNLSFWDKFSRFSQSDVSKNIDDFLMGAITASPNSSGWQLFAKGLKNLHEGDKQRGQVNQTVEYLKSKGYSEEEARFMARNPQMLSAMLTGGDKPQLDKGYEWYTNPETGERRARPVKGSMQELEYNQKLQAQKEWEHKKRKNMLLTKQQARIGINAIRDAIKIIREGLATEFVGWGSRDIGGTPAYELERLFETIKGGALKAVFESLKSMDPNGNLSVGPISDQESRNMIATFGSLDAGRKKEGLLKTLGMLEKTLVSLKRLDETQLYNWVTGQPINTPKEISDQYFVDSPMPQGGSENIPIVKSTEEIEALPKGQKFFIIDANGQGVPSIK